MKIAYTDFWPDFNPEKLPLTKLINGLGDIRMTESLEDADFLLFSCMGQKHWFAPDRVVKIFYTGENITPDFNACDYAIGFDWLDFGDRYLRFPLYYLYDDICEKMERKHLKPINEIVDLKKKFCSVTISNGNRNPIFKDLFGALSSYKVVDSGGKWANNIGGPVEDKFSFDLEHKFSLVCENSSSPGYTTEKLVQAFAANCIPIYWGDPAVTKVFNQKAFINVQDYVSIDDVVNKVREVDGNNEIYIEMLQQPALTDSYYLKDNQLMVLEKFLSNIFKYPTDKVKRRNRDFWGARYINTFRSIYNYEKRSNWIRLKEVIYDIIH